MEDTSGLSEYPGQGGTFFEVVLSREYSKGDVLTYDPLEGEQFHVSELHDVEPEGDGFRHYCQLSTLDAEKYFPPQFLRRGVTYTKVTNIMGEHGTNYSSIDLAADPVGTITNEFILGDPRSVESFYTAKAAAMKTPGLKAITDATREKALNKIEALGGNKDMYFITKALKDAEGKTAFSTKKEDVRVGPAIEYFVLAELAIMEAQSLVYAKAGAFETSYGMKMINEGAWHQYQRGKVYEYSRPGGFTLDGLHMIASYIFKNSDMDVLERRMSIKVGTMMHKNVMHLFRDEVNEQLQNMPAPITGQDSQIQGKLLTGKLSELSMAAVAFKSVQIPGIGWVEVILDESLDYQPLADKASAGFHGTGVAWTSYSAIIEDASSPEYSNVEKSVRGADLVQGGTKTANIYYIKPEFANTVFGYEQGRMANDAQVEYVQSSLKQAGRTFWAHSNSACLVLDITRQVIVKLKK